MPIVSLWLQKKVARTRPLSSAVFCLWLSMASLVPTIELILWLMDRPALQAEAAGPNQDARRSVLRAVLP